MTSTGSCESSAMVHWESWGSDNHLSEDTEFVHGVDNAQESVNGLGLLANHGLVDVKVDLVMIEVSLHLLTIDVKDVGVHDCKASSPWLITISEVFVAGVEYSIDEREVIFDLLVPLDVEASRGFGDRGLEIRHVEGR